MFAIITKYMRPTTRKGPRIMAYNGVGKLKVVIAYDHSLSIPQNHAAAARYFARYYGYDGTWAQANGENDKYVFVNIDASEKFDAKGL